jgi:hypothetical protein
MRASAVSMYSNCREPRELHRSRGSKSAGRCMGGGRTHHLLCVFRLHPRMLFPQLLESVLVCPCPSQRRPQPLRLRLEPLAAFCGATEAVHRVAQLSALLGNLGVS